MKFSIVLDNGYGSTKEIVKEFDAISQATDYAEEILPEFAEFHKESALEWLSDFEDEESFETYLDNCGYIITEIEEV